MYDGSPGKSFPNIFFEHTYPLFSLLRGAPIQTAPKPSLNMRKTALPIQELSLGDYDVWRTFMIFFPQYFLQTYLPPTSPPYTGSHTKCTKYWDESNQFIFIVRRIFLAIGIDDLKQELFLIFVST